MHIQTIRVKKGLLPALVAVLLVCCSKKNTPEVLADGSVYIQQALTSDTLGFQAPFSHDSIVVMQFNATIKGGVASSVHHVVFRVDTTLIAGYRALYGDSAMVLPAAAYFVDWSDCVIPLDSAQSQPAQINIVGESLAGLQPSTVYVLPVVIDNVDGNTTGAAPGQVLYLKITTDPSLVISKTGWSIVSYTSQLLPATNLLDNGSATAWVTTGAPPQDVVIDMGQSYTLTQVSFTNSSVYIAYGGYVTSANFQLSTDNVNWMNEGTVTGTSTLSPQTLAIGSVPARYIKFTVLSAAPCSLIPGAIFVGDISAMQ